jgi:RNA polymerase sigma factor (sigma-70 family)
LDGFQRDLVALLPRLRRFARSLTLSAHDADDLVQIAVERALARRSQWRADTSLPSWMFTIMKNAWIDETRARRRRGPHGDIEEAVGLADAAGADPLARTAVEQAMTRLPDEQRLAVTLVLVEGLSYAEAARVAEVPQGTLTSRLVRGRMTLAAELEGLKL